MRVSEQSTQLKDLKKIADVLNVDAGKRYDD